MASSSTEKMIRLKSYDGEEFVVTEVAALQSGHLSHMIEDNCTEQTIPGANVNARILAKVVQYCKQQIDAAHVSKTEMEQEEWVQQFLNEVGLKTTFDLMLVANYLDIRKLLLVTRRKIAGIMLGKSPEEISKIFNIKNDYTPEQEEEIRRENHWAFD